MTAALTRIWNLNMVKTHKFIILVRLYWMENFMFLEEVIERIRSDILWRRIYQSKISRFQKSIIVNLKELVIWHLILNLEHVEPMTSEMKKLFFFVSNLVILKLVEVTMETFIRILNLLQIHMSIQDYQR